MKTSIQSLLGSFLFLTLSFRLSAAFSPVLSTTQTKTVINYSLKPTVTLNQFNKNCALKATGGSTKATEKKELTQEDIAEMIEVTFVNACMQLATGYVDVLKLFLVATRAAYQQKIPLPQLFDLVSACPIQSANRPLSEEEIGVRSTWLNVGYLTLSTLEEMEDSSGKETFFDWDMDIPTEVRDQYFIAAQEAVKRERGESAKSAEDSTLDNDPLQAAIYKTNLKVIDLTLKLRYGYAPCDDHLIGQIFQQVQYVIPVSYNKHL